MEVISYDFDCDECGKRVTEKEILNPACKPPWNALIAGGIEWRTHTRGIVTASDLRNSRTKRYCGDCGRALKVEIDRLEGEYCRQVRRLTKWPW